MGKTEKYHILDREMGKAKNEEWGRRRTRNGVLEAGDGKYK